MMDVNDYDLIKVNEYLKINHQLVFTHVIMVGRRNQKMKQEIERQKKKKL
jgi:hypothetical protein